MKKTALALFAVAAALLAGCFSVKTEHEIKPIHITMDINLKVKQDVSTFLDDAKSRRHERRPKIWALCDAGKAEELPTGYLAEKGTLAADEAKLIADENADRKLGYEKIAKERGQSPEQIGKTAAKIIKIREEERHSQNN